MKLPFRYSRWYTPKYVHMVAQEEVKYKSKQTNRQRTIPAGQRLCTGAYCILFTHPEAITDDLPQSLLDRKDFCPKCRRTLVDLGVLEIRPSP